MYRDCSLCKIKQTDVSLKSKCKVIHCPKDIEVTELTSKEAESIFSLFSTKEVTVTAPASEDFWRDSDFMPD